MEKAYDHKKYEEEMYRRWEDANAFRSPTKEVAEKAGLKPFCIIMPPPNASDPMHMGHAMFVTVEDVMIRYHRMKGEATLWLPGTDHAGIETQFVFEKKLAKEGKSRFDFDRDTLYQMIWDHVKENSGVAVEQMKRLGASADWSRFKFTLDEDVVDTVLDTFVRLYEDGLVYRGEKLVNYCVKCGTGYSDLEVEHVDGTSPLYYIRYPVVGEDNEYLVVATVRPETMLGDVAVAVNPKDKRYADMVGKKVRLPLVDIEIPVIADKMVETEFGTGVVKITPAHDQNDWEVAERHGLAREQVIDERGKILTEGKYHEMKVDVARGVVVEDLVQLGLLEKVDEKYSNRLATCYRCHRVIEPLPMKQFFIKVKPLVEKALMALDEKKTKILGHWLKNLRDWNISRQIVWGIRIPVWYKKGDKEDWVVSKKSPGADYVQETDTFDTWFSSGQWPVVTLKTNKEGDFDYYYPTQVLETAYEILPFWVMRMMMLGIYLTGKSPFEYVYLHGLIRDEQGRKMSKSIGNVINPISQIEQYGADALRMALIMNSSPGVDKNASEAQVRGMRNFANKVWNAGRYVAGLSDDKETMGDADFEKKLSEVLKTYIKMMDELKVGLAAEMVYSEFWHWFCDSEIEKNKQGKVSAKILRKGLDVFLKLLHPFIPFVTEAVWQEMGHKSLLINETQTD